MGLKPGNILLDSDGHIVLIDFALSTKLNKESGGRSVKQCGSMVKYVAPGAVDIDNNIGYGASADYWSLGMILHELLTGNIPIVNDELKVTIEPGLDNFPAGLIR